MTREFAIKVLTELRGYGDKFANIGFDRKDALDMAIKSLEKIEHLTDRPCSACEFHSDNGCSKWNCVFEK